MIYSKTTNYVFYSGQILIALAFLGLGVYINFTGLNFMISQDIGFDPSALLEMEFFIGISLIIGPLFFLTAVEGVQIDCGNYTYKYFFKVYGIKFGKWKKLPQIKRLALVKSTDTVRVYGMTSHFIEDKDTAYELRLYFKNKSRYLIVSKSKKKANVVKDKQQLEAQLGY